MPSGKVCVTLLKSKNLVEDFQKKNGHANFSEALRYIIEDYFKLREQEIELLRTLPPKLFPYYKKEVNDYFKRLGETGN